MTLVADTQLAVHAHETLEEALQNGRLHAFQDAKGFAACIAPLLTALDWRGDPRHLAEALPHFIDELDLVDVRNLLALLNYQTRPVKIGLRHLDPRLMPCLYVDRSGKAMVALRQTKKGVLVFDSKSGEEKEIGARLVRGTAYAVDKIDDGDDRGAVRAQRNWVADVARRFRGTMVKLLTVTFFLNLMAVAIPLFIMTVYDRVIGKNAPNLLPHLCVGIGLLVFSDIGLRMIRARFLAYIGARMDNIIGRAALRQILYLPPAYTEASPIGAQVSRLREFESLRDLFTGPLAAALLELPFVLLFLVAITWLGGPIGIIPVVLIVLFALMAVMIMPPTRRGVAETTNARSRRHSFLVEMLTHTRAIKQAGAEGMWMTRFRELSAQTALYHFRSSQLAFLMQTISHVLMMGAGIATLAMGAQRVLLNEMSIGALIAVMALIWRALAPLQMGLMLLTKAEEVRLGLRQLNALMNLQVERERRLDDAYVGRDFSGRISFSRLSFRYPAVAEAALMGVNVEIPAGEMLAIAGANGSGKSTLLKLVAGLYRPQAGGVLLDGIDIRQLDPIELRHAVAYVPQSCTMFHGTIAQNLRLAEPTASDDDLRAACAEAALLDDIEALPDGFDTRIGDQKLSHLPSGFLQRLSLARAYLKDSPILLLDEPGQTLDEEGDRQLMESLMRMKGQRTVVMITHRPSHMKLADRVLVLSAGRPLMLGPPDEIMPKIPKGAL